MSTECSIDAFVDGTESGYFNSLEEAVIAIYKEAGSAGLTILEAKALYLGASTNSVDERDELDSLVSQLYHKGILDKNGKRKGSKKRMQTVYVYPNIPNAELVGIDRTLELKRKHIKNAQQVVAELEARRAEILATQGN